jgi:hypothetical protein
MTGSRGCGVIPAVAVALITLVLTSTDSVRAIDSASIYFEATTGNDTLVSGLRSAITVSLDPQTETIGGIDLHMLWLFSNGNTVGPHTDTGAAATVIVSTRADSVFESIGWNDYYGEVPTDPDTSVMGFADYGGDPIVWNTVTELVRFVFAPTDTGTITVIPKPPHGPPLETMFVNQQGFVMPYE